MEILSRKHSCCGYGVVKCRSFACYFGTLSQSTTDCVNHVDKDISQFTTRVWKSLQLLVLSIAYIEKCSTQLMDPALVHFCLKSCWSSMHSVLWRATVLQQARYRSAFWWHNQLWFWHLALFWSLWLGSVCITLKKVFYSVPFFLLDCCGLSWSQPRADTFCLIARDRQKNQLLIKLYPHSKSYHVIRMLYSNKIKQESMFQYEYGKRDVLCVV